MFIYPSIFLCAFYRYAYTAAPQAAMYTIARWTYIATCVDQALAMLRTVQSGLGAKVSRALAAVQASVGVALV